MSPIWWLGFTLLLVIASPGCDSTEPLQQQTRALDTGSVSSDSSDHDVEERNTGMQFALDSIAIGGSYLYRVPTSREDDLAPMGDSVLWNYRVKIGSDEVWLDHFYSPEVLDSGRMATEYCMYSRLWFGGRLAVFQGGNARYTIDRGKSKDPAHIQLILDLGKSNNEALVLERGSSRTVIVYGGYVWCNGHYCATLSPIVIRETASTLHAFQFDTGIWNEDRIWQFIRENQIDTVLRVPIIDSEYTPEKEPERWMNVDSMFAAMN